MINTDKTCALKVAIKSQVPDWPAPPVSPSDRPLTDICAIKCPNAIFVI